MYTKETYINFTTDIKGVGGTFLDKWTGKSLSASDYAQLTIDVTKAGWNRARHPALAALDNTSRLYIQGHCLPAVENLFTDISGSTRIPLDDIVALLRTNLVHASLRQRSEQQLKISLVACHAGCGWTSNDTKGDPKWDNSFGAKLHRRLGALRIYSIVHARTLTVVVSAAISGKTTKVISSPAITDEAKNGINFQFRNERIGNSSILGSKVAFTWEANGSQCGSNKEIDQKYIRKIGASSDGKSYESLFQNYKEEFNEAIEDLIDSVSGLSGIQIRQPNGLKAQAEEKTNVHQLKALIQHHNNSALGTAIDSVPDDDGDAGDEFTYMVEGLLSSWKRISGKAMAPYVRAFPAMKMRLSGRFGH